MKWYGDIAFNMEVEVERGVFEPKVVPKKFVGDVIKPAWNEQQGEKINEDLRVSNRLSVVADPFIQNNFHKIAYVTYGGAKWTVSGVEQDLNRPRLTLSLGSLYLEETGEEVDEEQG